MKVRGEILAVAAVASLLVGAAGCGNNDSASTEGASPAPEASSTMGAAEQAGKAVDQAGQNVKEGAKEAADQTAAAAHEAGHNIKQGAKAAGEEVAGAGAAVSDATKDAAAPLALTPKVKNALAASTQIDASTINVDTIADKKQVVLRGTVPSADKKALAAQIAEKELADSKSDYKVVNQLTVGKK